MSEVPADWYEDPEDPGQLRYWDGAAWTEHRSPKQQQPAAPPPPSGPSYTRPAPQQPEVPKTSAPTPSQAQPDLAWAHQAVDAEHGALPSQSPPASPQAPEAKQGPGPAKWASPVGFGLAIVGSLAPWATVTTVFGSLSVAGTEGDGVLTLVAGLAGLMIGLMAPSQSGRFVAFLIGAGIAVIAGYDLSSIARAAAETSAEGYVRAGVGWGLVVTLVGGVIAGWSPMLNLWPKPQN